MSRPDGRIHDRRVTDAFWLRQRPPGLWKDADDQWQSRSRKQHGIVTIGGNLSLASSSTTTMELVSSVLGCGLWVRPDRPLGYGAFPGLRRCARNRRFSRHPGGIVSVVSRIRLANWDLQQHYTFSQAEAAGTFDYSTGVLTLTAVPEPGTVALVGFSLLGLVVFRRRRAKEGIPRTEDKIFRGYCSCQIGGSGSCFFMS